MMYSPYIKVAKQSFLGVITRSHDQRQLRKDVETYAKTGTLGIPTNTTKNIS